MFVFLFICIVHVEKFLPGLGLYTVYSKLYAKNVGQPLTFTDKLTYCIKYTVMPLAYRYIHTGDCNKK